MGMHIDDFIHAYTRNPDSRTCIYTLTYSYAGTLVPSDAYVHTRAYTRAQRPSVALCLRPEISLACLANHGLDNNTVIDRTNPASSSTSFSSSTSSSSSSSATTTASSNLPPPRNVPPLERIERERDEGRKRSQPFSAPF